MSMQLINEMKLVIDGLFIAGSERAAEDPTLKKLLPQIREVGGKDPAFAGVADSLDRVLQPGGDSSKKLFELAVLVNAVFYTMVNTSVDGEPEDLESIELNLPTNTSYRRYKQIKYALCDDYQEEKSRLDLLREACLDGSIYDFRLYDYLWYALDDDDHEIADLAAETLKKFKITNVDNMREYILGREYSDMHRINLISYFKKGKKKEFYLKIIKEKRSDVLKIAAIKALKDCPDCEEMLWEFSKDQNKEYRDAAQFALAHMGTDRVVKRLYEIFNSKERDTVIYPIIQCRAKEMSLLLLNDGERLLEDIMKPVKDSQKTGKKAKTPSMNVLKHFAAILECMEGKQDPEIIRFLEKCLEHAEHLKKFGKKFVLKNHSALKSRRCNLVQIAAENIMIIGSPQLMELMGASSEKYGDALLPFSFEVDLRSREPSYVFDRYAKFVSEGRTSETGCGILETMDQYIELKKQYQLDDDNKLNPQNNRIANFDKTGIKWDRRWIKVLAEADEVSMVSRLITEEDSEFTDYLLKKLNDVGENGTKVIRDIVRGLLQAGYPDMNGVVIKVLDIYFKNSQQYKGYVFNDLLQVFRLLPKECARALEEVAVNREDMYSTKLFNAAQYLREKRN